LDAFFVDAMPPLFAGRPFGSNHCFRDEKVAGRFALIAASGSLYSPKPSVLLKGGMPYGRQIAEEEQRQDRCV
jgi:hypothetical protein